MRAACTDTEDSIRGLPWGESRCSPRLIELARTARGSTKDGGSWAPHREPNVGGDIRSARGSPPSAGVTTRRSLRARTERGGVAPSQSAIRLTFAANPFAMEAPVKSRSSSSSRDCMWATLECSAQQRHRDPHRRREERPPAAHAGGGDPRPAGHANGGDTKVTPTPDERRRSSGVDDAAARRPDKCQKAARRTTEATTLSRRALRARAGRNCQDRGADTACDARPRRRPRLHHRPHKVQAGASSDLDACRPACARSSTAGCPVHRQDLRSSKRLTPKSPPSAASRRGSVISEARERSRRGYARAPWRPRRTAEIHRASTSTPPREPAFVKMLGVRLRRVSPRGDGVLVDQQGASTSTLAGFGSPPRSQPPRAWSSAGEFLPRGADSARRSLHHAAELARTGAGRRRALSFTL